MSDKREFLTVTVAAHTRARIVSLSRLTGLSRGRLVDMALEAIGPCEACRGTGRARDRGAMRGTTIECAECRGAGVHPKESHQ